MGDFTRAFQGVGAKEPAKPASATEVFDTTAPGEPAREEPNLAVRRGPSVGPGLLTQQWMAGLGEGARLPRCQAFASENSGGPAGTPATASESFGEAPRSAPAAADGDQAGTPARPGGSPCSSRDPGRPRRIVPSRQGWKNRLLHRRLVLWRENSPGCLDPPSQGRFSTDLGAPAGAGVGGRWFHSGFWKAFCV